MAYCDVVEHAHPNTAAWTIAIAGSLTLFMPVIAHRRHVEEDLQTWDHQDEKAQELALQRAKRYVANGRSGVWFFATLVLMGISALFSGFVSLIHTGVFADWVKDAAVAAAPSPTGSSQ